MAYYLRRFKKTDECDAAPVDAPMCAAPFSSVPDGMGPVIPMVSGDRFDNILGAGCTQVAYPKQKRFKIKRKKK